MPDPGNIAKILGDSASFGGLIQTGRTISSINKETLSANKTLAGTDPSVQSLNGGASDRDVTLPASPATGLTYLVKNAGSTNALVIKANGGSPTVATVAVGVSVTVIYNGTAWETF